MPNPDPLYTATVAVAALGLSPQESSGRAVSDDGALSLVLRSPSRLGGHGAGTNAEQLLAAAMASGFHASLIGAARARRIRFPDKIGIVAEVHVGREQDSPGLCLTAALEAAMPGLSLDDVRTLTFEAAWTCPYVKMATWGMRPRFTIR